MANGHGGYRRPSKPAAVSGPGSLSKRTDGGPTDTRQPVRESDGFAYGERKRFEELQASAPMAQAEPTVQATPLFAPTERPDEPVTSGSPLGPGAGPAAPKTVDGRVSRRLAMLAAYDESGDIGWMADVLASRGL